MLNKTTENFLEVMSTFAWPEPAVVSYRLYYNDDGTLKCYSMEDLPYKYVEVDAKTFAERASNVRIIDGKIHYIKPAVTVKKLVPVKDSGSRCAPQDVCIIVSPLQPHTFWTTKSYETS